MRFWIFCPRQEEKIMLKLLDEMFKKIFWLCIRGYQKVISPLFPPTCRYHPTCSSYSLTLFELTPSFYALFFSIIRILKCNQYFKGGFDYPCINVTLEDILHSPRRISYWLIPCRSFKMPLFVCKPIQFRAYIVKDFYEPKSK